MNRHQHIALKEGDPIANVRMDCVGKEVMKNYFWLLKDILGRHAWLYNVNEMGMLLDKVFVRIRKI